MLIRSYKEEIIGIKNTNVEPSKTLAKLSGISMEDLQDKASLMKSTSVDYPVDTELTKIKFTDDLQLQVGSRRFDLTEHMFNQYCQILGIPVVYMKKCIDANKLDLFKENIDTWATDLEKKLVLRTNRGVARALVSRNYVAYDNDEILDDISSVLDVVGMDLVPVGAYLNEDYLNLRLVDTRRPIQIKGETSPLYIGINVINSNVGTSSTYIKFFIYKQTNRCSFIISEGGGTLYKQTHAGRHNKLTRQLNFQSALRNIAYLRDDVEIAMNEVRHRFLDEHEMNVLLDKMKSEINVSEKAIKTIKEIATNQYDSTLYGVASGISRISQEFDLATRSQLEQYAGKIILIDK